MMYVYGRGLASSGRFEVEMGIGLPNLTEKEEILQRKLATMKTDPDLDFPKLSKFVGTVYVLLINMETIDLPLGRLELYLDQHRLCT
mgnify:FL=1